MSRLIISTPAQSFTMNVLDFSSPIYGTIASAQTKHEAIHFPIKITQPEIQFDVIFANEKDFQDFQKFVGNHQQNALNSTELLNLSWPERNIYNWTGVIRQFTVGGARFNYTPRARFVVDLVDSTVSARTEFASFASGWQAIYGLFGPVGAVLDTPSIINGDPELARQQQQNPAPAGSVSTNTTPGPANPPANRILTGSTP